MSYAYDQWVRQDQEKEDLLSRRPECSNCGHPVQEEHLFLINDEVICPGCMDRDFRKDVEDY